MDYWLLLVDLDGVLWDHLDISILDPPFRRVSSMKIIDSNGVEVNLNRDILEYIKWCRDRGAITSTLSWNIYWKALEALRAFRVVDLFDYLMIEYTDRKDLMLRRLLEMIKGDMGLVIGVDRIIYIDDRDIHIDQIYSTVGRVNFIKYSRGLTDLDYLVEYTGRVLGL